MDIKELKNLFCGELSALYSITETDELFAIFCKEYLELSKIELRLSEKKTVAATIERQFLKALTQLKNGIPYQYILGYTEFYGKRFKVSKAVLIPRPETEELLELAIAKIRNNEIFIKDKNFRILDIGTGSGIIPIILKQSFPDSIISALDFSEEALEVAEENAKLHNVNINFILADYLKFELVEKYDVIISNPPYIGMNESAEIEDSVKNTEPKMALFSPTNDPLVFYRKIAEDAKTNLKKDGLILLEINQKLGADTLALFECFSKSELLKDISNNDRFVLVTK